MTRYCLPVGQLRLAAVVGVVLALLAVSIQSDAAESRGVRFQHISRDRGLSQSFVYTIVQDHEGYMWFGTQEGLNRFDGFDVSIFSHDPNDPLSISDESIRTMIEDRSGTLWIGTDAGGLSRYNNANQTFTNYLHDPTDSVSISDNRVRVIYEDSSEVLWVGTDGAGLDRFDRVSERFDHYPHDPANPGSLSNDNVWSILEDSDGVLWIATDSALDKFDPGTGSFAHYEYDADDQTSISDDHTRVLYEDKDHTLWIGTETGGLNRFDRENGSFERFTHDPADPSSISANRITAIFQDAAGVLWIGTVKGLNAWNPDTRSFDRYFHDPANRYSLSQDSVLSIYQDRGDVLWIGTYDGLAYWNQATSAMLHYRTDANDTRSLNENTVTSFAEDMDGNIWVATFGGGLNLLNRSTDRIRHLKHAPDDGSSLSSDQVMAVHVDSDGVLWAGTRSAGLNRYDVESDAFTRYSHDPENPTSLSSDGVTYVHEDRNKTLWIGTFGGGLNKFDRETRQFKHFRNEAGNPLTLSNDRVLVLFEDSAGSIWIGTYGGGLNRFDPGTETFTHYRAEPGRPDGLSGDEIYMIQEDSHGDLWIGVKGSGLNRWRSNDREAGKASFQRLTELDGLPSSTIYSGIFDQEGFLWLSTSRGLSRLNIGSLTFKNYDTSHGLQGDEFNLAAGYRAADGQIFFGGLNGLNAFYPDLLPGNQNPPQVVIRSFLSLNSPVDIDNALSNGERLQLEHDQNLISFEFAALDYAAPEKNRYMYQLEGLDDDWVNSGTKRQVTYTNLAAGKYTFRVRASNNDGIWSKRDAVLDIYMQPAPWKSWWAYLLYLSILAGILVAALRTHARRTQQAAKLRYADELKVIQARLKDAQRIANIGNWEWNTVTNEVWWSDEIYRLFQIDPKTFGTTYESFLERVHPDDRDTVNHAVDRALNAQEPYSMDHRIVQSDGTERFVHERAEVSFDEDGQAVRMAGTVHDITERKRAENEIEALKNQLQKENFYLREEVRLAHGFDEIVGEDPGLRRCLLGVEKVAPTDVTVLITGETGTGKELIARAIHKLSSRRAEPMVSVNCPALPANLIESELFGHEKGAFTGAHSQRRGRFELADGGTLFLDEIGDLPLELQAKLLRVLQTGEFQRIGGSETLTTDVRLITATNRDLPSDMDRDRFRADLYYRISTFPIRVPPLRDRRDDIPVLCEHFTKKHAARLGKEINAISAEMIMDLVAYDWPGNVRELESTIERALISSDNNTVLELPGKPQWMERKDKSDSSLSFDNGTDLYTVERSYIINVLEQSSWKISGVSGAAAVLGMPTSTLRSKMKRLGISRKSS